MALIDDEHMGDVWPSVAPGAEAADYGAATLSPTGPVPIRNHQTLTIAYTAGRFGLDDTGAIRVAFRFVHDGGRLQTADPAAANYVTATASNGVRLVVFPEPYAFRPWLHALRVTVTGGYLREGDQITVTIGDRSGGSPGFRVQTISEADFEFRVSVDACATGQFHPLADRLSLPIVAGPAKTATLVAPGLRRPGERFRLGVRFEDAWGNPAAPDIRRCHLYADGPIDGLPDAIEMPDGQTCLSIEGVSIAAPGVVRVSMRDPEGALLCVSNPIVVATGEAAGYWGDLHGQSGETVGIGSIDEYMAYARDAAFLDVTSHQGNDFQIKQAFWAKINQVTADWNEDGRFTVFPGYEWSGNTPVGGDHNVYYKHEGRPIVRSSHAMLTDRDDLSGDANTLSDLFKALQGEDCVLWAHVGGRPADVSYAHDPTLRTAVEVHSNWGTFEWILADSLALGHRVGVVASSDGHKGRPGAGSPGATEFGAYGGLTCFLAPELTRDAIFECMRRRHHYGTSGSRLHLDVRAAFDAPTERHHRDPRHADSRPQAVRDVIMGDIAYTQGDQATVAIALQTASPIERVDLMNGADLIRTIRCYRADDLGRRLRIFWRGAEYRGRGRNTRWTGEIELDGARIAAMTPINRWNLDRRLEAVDDRCIVFDAVTSGNFGGVDLQLDRIEDARVDVRTNHVDGAFSLSALGVEDAILDAGGLGRQIVVRRLPDDLDCCALSESTAVSLRAGVDNSIWVRVATLDGHLAWSSPIYIVRR